MSQWVECVCQVCGLRPYQSPEEEEEEGEGEGAGQTESGGVTSQQPAPRAISGPYMHLSECFTGASRPPIESHVR
jgi:hypothetical protein